MDKSLSQETETQKSDSSEKMSTEEFWKLTDELGRTDSTHEKEGQSFVMPYRMPKTNQEDEVGAFVRNLQRRGKNR